MDTNYSGDIKRIASRYIIKPRDLSLYLQLEDEKDKSTCHKECTDVLEVGFCSLLLHRLLDHHQRGIVDPLHHQAEVDHPGEGYLRPLFCFFCFSSCSYHPYSIRNDSDQVSKYF